MFRRAGGAAAWRPVVTCREFDSPGHKEASRRRCVYGSYTWQLYL